MRTNLKKGNAWVIAVAVLAVILFVGSVFIYSASRVAPEQIIETGAAAPVSTTNNVISSANDIYTSVNATSTPSTSYTLIQKDILGFGSILLTPTVDSISLTLPASTTVSSFIPKAGQRTSLLIVNGTSTAAKTITIVTGTGVVLKNASTSAAIGPGAVGLLEFVRKTNTDIDAFFVPAI